MASLEEAKSLAGSGEFQEALNTALSVLQESHDAPNSQKADILVFLGACYMTMEQQPEARFCYQMAQKERPDHPKLAIALGGLQGVTPKAPLALRDIYKDEAKEAVAMAAIGASVSTPAAEESGSGDFASSTTSDDVWAKAFPDKPDDSRGGFLKFVLILIVFAAIAWIIYVTVFEGTPQ